MLDQFRGPLPQLSELVGNNKTTMLALRLKRIGKKHQASFRVVVGERRSKLKGGFLEDVGWYNPREKKGQFNTERIKYWIGVGAQPSATVHNLLITHKVIEGKKVANHNIKKKKTEAK